MSQRPELDRACVFGRFRCEPTPGGISPRLQPASGRQGRVPTSNSRARSRAIEIRSRRMAQRDQQLTFSGFQPAFHCLEHPNWRRCSNWYSLGSLPKARLLGFKQRV